MFIILLFRVCLSGCILGPWTSYRHGTGIIRTSVDPKGDTGKKFVENWLVAK